MRGRPAVVLAGAVLLAACASRPVAPAPRRAWMTALAAADGEASAGRYAAADSTLDRFLLDNPTSPDSLEALFWRALFRADPANPSDSAAATAVPLIDRYLAAGTGAHLHWREAEVIRRLLTRRAAPPPQARVDTVRVVDSAAVRRIVTRETEARNRVHEDEMQQLRDSLTRTTAELDRIRRRLAPAPTPQRP